MGMRFDGESTLQYFFNGFEVARVTLLAGTHPVDVEMGPIVAHKTGDTAAVSVAVDWIRYAHQERDT
jgi:hypothetical protein